MHVGAAGPELMWFLRPQTRQVAIGAPKNEDSTAPPEQRCGKLTLREIKIIPDYRFFHLTEFQVWEVPLYLSLIISLVTYFVFLFDFPYQCLSCCSSLVTFSSDTAFTVV